MTKNRLLTYQSRGEDQTDDQAEEESVSEYRPVPGSASLQIFSG
jgi:hypothetical protein